MNAYNTEINNSAVVSWHPNVGGGIAPSCKKLFLPIIKQKRTQLLIQRESMLSDMKDETVYLHIKKVSWPMWDFFRFRDNDSLITAVCRTYRSTVSVKGAIQQTVHPPLSLSSCRFCHCTDSKLYYFASTESGNVTLMLRLLTADAFLLYSYPSELLV